MDEQGRSVIRQSLLRGFESTEELPRAGAALSVSAVACIDLLHERWGDLGGILTSVLQNAGVPPPTKEAIMKAVTFIGENLENQDVPPAVGRMLVELSVIGLSIPDVKCACQSALALAAAIPLASELFESPSACANLVNTIKECWTRIEDPEFRFSIFFCALPLVQYGYESISPFMDFFVTISLEAISHKTKAALPALAFWSSLAECEDELEDDSKNLVDTHMPALIEPLFTAAVEGNTDEDTEEPFDEESLAVMALYTLKTLAKCTSNHQMLQCIILFFDNNSGHADRRYRDVAMYCFGLLCMQGKRCNLVKDTNFQSKIVNQLEIVLAKAVNDPSPGVRDTAMYSILNFVEHLPEISLNERYLKTLVGIIVDRLQKDCMRVVKQCAPALFVVHQALEESEKLLIFIQPNEFKMIVETLYTVGNKAFSEGYPDIGSSCYETLDEWIRSVDQDSLKGFAETLFVALRTYTDPNVTANIPPEVLDAVQDALLNSLANLTYCLRTNIEQIAASFIEVSMKIFETRTNNRKPLPYAGLRLVEMLISKLKTRFEPYIGAVYPVLRFALEDADNHRTCTCACSCMSLLTMHFPSQILMNIDEIIRVVGHHFENPYVETRLRGEIIALMSNLAAMETSHQNLPLVVAALTKTANATVAEDSDEEILRAADQMYAEVCEAYSRLILSKPKEIMAQHVMASSTVLAQIAQRCNHKLHKPYVYHLFDCIRMITDLLTVFKTDYATALVSQMYTNYKIVYNAVKNSDGNFPVYPGQTFDESNALGTQVLTGLTTALNPYKNMIPNDDKRI